MNTSPNFPYTLSSVTNFFFARDYASKKRFTLTFQNEEGIALLADKIKSKIEACQTKKALLITPANSENIERNAKLIATLFCTHFQRVPTAIDWERSLMTLSRFAREYKDKIDEKSFIYPSKEENALKATCPFFTQDELFILYRLQKNLPGILPYYDGEHLITPSVINLETLFHPFVPSFSLETMLPILFSVAIGIYSLHSRFLAHGKIGTETIFINSSKDLSFSFDFKLGDLESTAFIGAIKADFPLIHRMVEEDLNFIKGLKKPLKREELLSLQKIDIYQFGILILDLLDRLGLDYTTNKFDYSATRAQTAPLNPHTPPHIREIFSLVHKMMHKNKEERPSIEQVLIALIKMLSEKKLLTPLLAKLKEEGFSLERSFPPLALEAIRLQPFENLTFFFNPSATTEFFKTLLYTLTPLNEYSFLVVTRLSKTTIARLELEPTDPDERFFWENERNAITHLGSHKLGLAPFLQKLNINSKEGSFYPILERLSSKMRDSPYESLDEVFAHVFSIGLGLYRIHSKEMAHSQINTDNIVTWCTDKPFSFNVGIDNFKYALYKNTNSEEEQKKIAKEQQQDISQFGKVMQEILHCYLMKKTGQLCNDMGKWTALLWQQSSLSTQESCDFINLIIRAQNSVQSYSILTMEKVLTDLTELLKAIGSPALKSIQEAILDHNIMIKEAFPDFVVETGKCVHSEDRFSFSIFCKSLD